MGILEDAFKKQLIQFK